MGLHDILTVQFHELVFIIDTIQNSELVSSLYILLTWTAFYSFKFMYSFLSLITKISQ